MACSDYDIVRPATSYEGKYIDRFPKCPTAGIIAFRDNETVAQCLKMPTDKPPTPEPCDRLRQWTNTPLEKHRIFHAQINDPQLKKSRTMTHGIHYPKGPGAADLINPIPKSVYQQHNNEWLESIYKSRQLKPLGHSFDPVKNFPSGFNWKDACFGIKYVYTGNAKELINPDKTTALIYEENKDDHDKYLVSHRHLYPGEQAKRGYSSNPKFCQIDSFGIPTPCNYQGLQTKASMRWWTDREMEKKTPIVSKRLEEYREKHVPQIGLPLDPIKDTRIIGPNYAFGIRSKPDLYKMEDLLHGKIPYYFNTGPNRKRAVMGAIHNHLRSLHYNHYKDLRDACQVLDTDNTGLLSEECMHSLCKQFDVPVDPQLLEQVFDICQEKDQINWRNFTDNFNWHERLDFDKLDPDYSYSGDPCESNLADWNVQNRLQREVERVLADWTTSNSMYNGGGVLKGKNFKAMGAPSVRSDLMIPKIRKATNKICYGDEGGARCTINPSIMTKHGITEMDLLVPRSKSELKNIYENTCDHKSESDFDYIWQVCNDRSNKGEQINLEMFKQILSFVEAERIRAEVIKNFPMVQGCFAYTGSNN